MSSRRKTQGRRKIEIKRMTNDSNMQVTFLKRHSELLMKASELSTLCGATVSLVVLSPGGEVFSFGHPNVDTIIDRYLSHLPSQNNGTVRFIEAQHNANVRELIPN
ncbi:agamous MADS-box protein AGL62 [Trifolium repens]|nr:agamous MADS-box protein AGL62 [Trifolium repens]